MGDQETPQSTTFSLESMKVIAESIGIAGLPDDAARELAEDISNKLKSILQDASKFMHHSKRMKLIPDDIDHALKIRNIEPQYGFLQMEPLPFRFASGGGRELHFIEEKEIDLNEMLASPAPKVPLEVTVRAHWLAVDGIQPTIPENPSPVNKEALKTEATDPLSKLSKSSDKDSAGKPTSSKLHKLKNVETVHVKQLATHELSVEQQLYYKEITEACAGSDEARRAEALQSLACDPGLHEMLPRMCTFISEGVKVNVVQNNLALLIYLMRMVKALLDNQSLYLEKYLHELIPSVSTCIVSKQLCMRPDFDNHWALRDFASRLMAQICKNYNSSTNNVQTRVTRLFSKVLNPREKESDKSHHGHGHVEKTPLSTLYGAIHGLSELGPEVIKTFILPRVRWIGEKIENNIDSPINADKLAVGHIKHIMGKIMGPVIKTVRSAPDLADEYRRDYGYLGTTLHVAVVKARNASNNPTSSGTNMQLYSPVPISIVTSTPSIVLPSPQAHRQNQIPPSNNLNRTMVVNPQVNRVISSQTTQNVPTQKFVIVTQKNPNSGISQAGLNQIVSSAIQQQQPVFVNTVVQQPTTVIRTNAHAAASNPLVPKPIFIGQGNAPPPPEVDDLSHLA